MSLVLAVQPDADQASRLSSVCRRIGAELVLAPSAPEALAALGGRVPDVILSAPLLPASDEAVLAERLRALGDDALHVQAISAPVLGDAPVEAPQPKGLLKALKKPRRASAPAVCDPVAFAGELSGHLLRAIAERAAITSEPIEAPVVEIVPAFPRVVDDLWPHQRASSQDASREVGQTFDSAHPSSTGGMTLNVSKSQGTPSTRGGVKLDATAIRSEVPLKPDTTAGRTSDGAHAPIPDAGSRIGDGDRPIDIELIALVDAIAEKCRPRKRKKPGTPRRKRRTYDDAAYFDPARSEFAAVVDKFDEFTRQHPRVA